jgi:hypothetical protein
MKLRGVPCDVTHETETLLIGVPCDVCEHSSDAVAFKAENDELFVIAATEAR